MWHLLRVYSLVVQLLAVRVWLLQSSCDLNNFLFFLCHCSVRPAITTSPLSLNTSESTFANFTTKIYAFPEAVIIWTKDGVPVSDEERYHLSPDNTTLSISGAQWSDRGMYQFNASNAHVTMGEGGSVTSNAVQLEVYGRKHESGVFLQL